jgi:2-haloacid dehalogenase
VSSNGWDAAGAAAFGFTTFWINRNGEPVERHAPEPDFIVGSLANLLPIAQMGAS